MIKKLLSILIVVLAISLLTSCTSQQSSGPNGAGDQVQSTVDSVTMCEGWDINTGFTPVCDVYAGWGSIYYLGNFYETLVNYENGKIIPGLAETWQVNGNELVFNLRKGIKFTDGTGLTAEVVKKNFDMIPVIMPPEYVSSITLLTRLEEVKVVNDYTVAIKLKEPYYVALQELAVVRPMGIMSVNAYTKDGLSDEVFKKTFGTGKYYIEDAVKGKDYTFTRNESYWGEKPQIKQFTVKTIPDSTSRSLALKNGEVDFLFGANNITQDSFNEFKGDERFEAKASQSTVKTRKVILNTTKKPLDDINVRKAILHAVNKQSICDSLFSSVEVEADYLFSPSLPYCDLQLEPINYDVDMANNLLEQAGWLSDENGFRKKEGQLLEINLMYDGGTGLEDDLVLTLAEQLKKVGVKVELVGLEHMAASYKALSGDFQMFLTITYGIPYEPHTDINHMQAGGWNNQAQLGLAQKKDIDKTISQLFTMVDEEEIQKAYDYILGTLHNEALYLPISYKRELVVFNKDRIRGYDFDGQPLNVNVSGIIPK